MNWFEDFETRQFDVNGVRIFARVSHGMCGARPALLLLHGFPQTHVMWNRVAHALVNDFYLVMPDLRGYGDSGKPPGLPDHSNYSKRVMAQDMVEVMNALGIDRFALCGHDRGGRVAHRLALDHPERVAKLSVIDIAPTQIEPPPQFGTSIAREFIHGLGKVGAEFIVILEPERALNIDDMVALAAQQQAV